MRTLVFIGLALIVAIAWGASGEPNDEFYARAWAVQIVDEAAKPYRVTYAPQVIKRAPDGAVIVAGIATTARGREIAYQLRVERRCTNPDMACYKPHIAYLGPPGGAATASAAPSGAGADAPQSPGSKRHRNRD